MLAAVGGETPFAPGREQLKLLADLEVTAKAIERTAESIGADIEVRQQQDIRRAKQLCLPAMVGPPIPHLYVQMDGTQVFVVKSETEGRAGRTPGQPAAPANANWAACLHKPVSMIRAGLCATRVPPRMSALSRPPKTSGSGSIRRPAAGAGTGPRSESSWVMARTGSGISPTGIFPARFKSSISTMHASISGTWLVSYIPPMTRRRCVG